MKKAILVAIGTCITSLMLMACGGAQAQVIAGSFTSSNDKVFTTDGIRSFECKPGYIELVYATGNNSYTDLTDNTGSVCANVKAAPGFVNFVRVGISERYVQATSARITICDAIGTNIIWQHGSNENFSGDGCALHAAIRARSKMP